MKTEIPKAQADLDEAGIHPHHHVIPGISPFSLLNLPLLKEQ